MTDDDTYDLIVIGGGIHGLMIALQAAEIGHRTVLLERDRIGAATTAGWFGILHGGLRYLQSLDIRRFRESLADSRWFQCSFPDLVRRQGFLMPLYGQGLKRPGVFRAAFLTDRILGLDRNSGIARAQALPMGRVLSAREVVRAFPGVLQGGLTGGALWEERVVPDTPALMSALVARARAVGLDLRERTTATELLTDGRNVTGVRAGDQTWAAPKVVIAAGAQSDALARRFDPRPMAPLGTPARAFNLLIDRAPPSAHGLSLVPPGDDGPMLFAYPSGGRTFAGTAYLPAGETVTGPIPEAEIARFLNRLNAALPGFAADPADVLQVTDGLLPAAEPGAQALLDRDQIRDHGASGGPKGLVSLWGVKFTTAPGVARQVLATVDTARRA
ncbi:FAD-dependent oxidoreductase [Marinibacterium sp. SX1]|uniref:FAD-dependent oxidoreductase n=1 Tax=Marinibacterium sp. SX1 TaxID=3388424 RepID=UPI003D175FB7